jgi:hypothetical protein
MSVRQRILALRPLARFEGFLRRQLYPQRDMKLILVCGAWGGGTSAVAGMVSRLGAQGLGPYVALREPQTPLTYESTAFRELVLQYASEETLALKQGAEEDALIHLRALRGWIEENRFGRYDPNVPLFFKYPLSALLIPQICAVFDTRLVYVVRSLEHVERSRLRRNWPAYRGRVGAEVIYRVMDDFARRHSQPILTLNFAELLATPAEHARELARFGGLIPDPAALRETIAFIRPEDTARSRA